MRKKNDSALVLGELSRALFGLARVEFVTSTPELTRRREDLHSDHRSTGRSPVAEGRPPRRPAR